MKKTYLSLPDNKERDEQISPLTWKESHILWKQTEGSNSIENTLIHECFFENMFMFETRKYKPWATCIL